jgi:hypothetical protein
MTSIDDDIPDPRRLLVRLVQRIGHRKARTWLCYVLGDIAAAILCGLFYSPVFLVALLILVLATGVLIMKLEEEHDHRLCEACIAEVPLDPGAAVAKADRALRISHWTVDHQRLFRAIMIGFVGFAASVFFFVATGSRASLGFGVADFAVLLGFVWLTRVFNTHRRLHPWCPYCRRRGGGGGLHMPSPEPAGSTGRRR